MKDWGIKKIFGSSQIEVHNRVNGVRKLMKDWGIKNTPRCSWIEVHNRIIWTLLITLSQNSQIMPKIKKFTIGFINASKTH